MLCLIVLPTPEHAIGRGELLEVLGAAPANLSGEPLWARCSSRARGLTGLQRGGMRLASVVSCAGLSRSACVCVRILCGLGRCSTFRGRRQSGTINALSSATSSSYPAALPQALALPQCPPLAPNGRTLLYMRTDNPPTKGLS